MPRLAAKEKEKENEKKKERVSAEDFECGSPVHLTTTPFALPRVKRMVVAEKKNTRFGLRKLVQKQLNVP